MGAGALPKRREMLTPTLPHQEARQLMWLAFAIDGRREGAGKTKTTDVPS